MTSIRLPHPWPAILTVVGFAALIAVAAQVSVPMHPVPMTMQTWAVLTAGAIAGPRVGLAAVLVYLAAAAVGLPVLSDGRSGLWAMAGASAGYLIAFPAAAFLIGWVSERGGLERPLPAMAALTGAHLMILAAGTGWLMFGVGLDPPRALAVGFTPFLIGAVVKSGLVLLCRWGWSRLGIR